MTAAPSLSRRAMRYAQARSLRADPRARPQPPRRALRPEKICVIVNAHSGRGDHADQQDEIRRAFAALGHEADFEIVGRGHGVDEITRSVLHGGYDTVVAAGGDGTICAVASALVGTGRRMGVIPLGTFNYFARSLGLPETLPEAVSIIVDGATRPVRAATLNDRLFLNNASLGIYPAILKNREDIYRRWGRSRIAAYWSVLKTLVTLRRPLRLTIHADGVKTRIRTPLVFAVNNAYQLKEIGLEGGEDIAAGKLLLFAAPDAGRWGMLRHTLALALGRAVVRRDFQVVAAREIDITSAHPQGHVARDGERERMTAPFRLRIIEDGLLVAVPDDKVAKVR